MKVHQYLDANGNFDYKKYVAVQTAGNIRKLRAQWVDRDSVKFLADYIIKTIGQPKFGICHGTRQGSEQAWFAEFLNCDVLGTEISTTAERFPRTIRWDFHEVKPEWLNAVDFIYSNSWDHSFDPVKMFKAWLSCVRPGGVCIIDHHIHQTVSTELDPFSVAFDELIEFIDALGNGNFRVKEVLRGVPKVLVNANKPVAVRYVVIERI